MNLWHLGLFAAASLLALRSFVSLTSYHQRYTLRKMMKEHHETLRQKTAKNRATNAAA